MKKYILILSVSLLVMTSSCRKYVEIEINNSNNRLLKYTSDFQSLLNNYTVFSATPSLPMLSSDDIDAGADQAAQNRLTTDQSNVYTWAENYYDATQSDAGWDQLYNQIYVCNEVLAKVMTSENGTDEAKHKIYAEAQVQRSYAYLTLINLYAPIYQKDKANTTLGVPLLLVPNLFQKLNRVSLETVYQQIFKDIAEALPFLPTYPSLNTHPGKAAAYATLARAYLMRQEYALAQENARKALEIQNTLVDLTTYQTTPTQFPRHLNNPEIILSRSALFNTNIPLNPTLLQLFDTNDLRYMLFTRVGTAFAPNIVGRGYYKGRLTVDLSINSGPSVGEMMLIQAEGFARNNQTDQALQVLNTLRAKRFTAANYKALQATTAQQALGYVLDERRRELMGTGLRWLDQRRLSLESEWAKSVTRTYKNVSYTLAPASNRYVYPIGPKYIDLNPEIQQNDR